MDFIDFEMKKSGFGYLKELQKRTNHLAMIYNYLLNKKDMNLKDIDKVCLSIEIKMLNDRINKIITEMEGGKYE